jgi:hypothetical protein
VKIWRKEFMWTYLEFSGKWLGAYLELFSKTMGLLENLWTTGYMWKKAGA